VIAKMKREMFGPRSEGSQRLIDQLELQLEELAAEAGEDEAKAETTRVHVHSFTRQQATRRNFPADLPRRRLVHPAPTSCPCCGSSKLSKIGEDITETLDVVPRQWFVTEHMREKFSCRSCEKITQPPAPFHAIARGFAGPSLLAMILVDKYANHQPLNRQSEQFACEGIELSVSTMADHVGACAATLKPLYELIKAHVFAAERIHGDDTTVTVLAKLKTRTGRIWTYVRDDRPFAGKAPPAAVFSTHRIEPASIPSSISPVIAGSFRLTPMPDSIRSTSRIEGVDQSPRPDAGRMRGASCLSLPTSPRRRARARRP
jgi:transposase